MAAVERGGLQRAGFNAAPTVSVRMRKVHRADTKPELLLRSALWRRGLRFYKDRRVAGRHVDVSFPGARLAVFVDGCFWHGCPEHWSLPTKNREYWERKITVVRDRDAEDSTALAGDGWTVLRLWEHEVVASPEETARRVEQMVRRGIRCRARRPAVAEDGRS